MVKYASCIALYMTSSNHHVLGLENIFFYFNLKASLSLSLIQQFLDFSQIVKWFKPGLLSSPFRYPSCFYSYTRPCHVYSTFSLFKAPDRYGVFTPLSLSTTLSSISIPSSYTWARENQCKKNYRDFKKITLGTLCVVLPQSNLFEVNEFPPSSFTLMAF
ncbi:hypothetical protein V8G54_021187 [Vigna mungo]|uniref:Uncharacterized protein n=1 Tax=Vigna mungo TaxID=3915 RepID=A0AAQ3NDV4_VIGMU